MERRNFLKRAAGAAGMAFVPTNAANIDDDLREQDDLPSFQELAERHDIPTEQLILAMEGEGWRAIASPGIVAADGISTDKHGSPFHFDGVGDLPDNEMLGAEFSNVFDAAVGEIYDKVSNSDDPLQTILDMDPPRLIKGGEVDES